MIPLLDDPFDNNQNLGIAYEKVFTPFGTDEKTVYFDSIVQTQREIAECTQIVMTGDTDKEEEESRKICEIVQASKVCELKTDRIMGGVRDVFVEREMTERLIYGINVLDVKVNGME